MKISPLEIRQKQFTKKTFGGVDPDEVQAFLTSLSNAWERLLDENKELRLKLESSEREASELREVRSSLFKTLQTAEDTSKNIEESARQKASLLLRDAQIKVDQLNKEARWQAKKVVEDAEEEAKKILKNLQGEVKSLEQDYRSIENQRDNLLTDLRNLGQELLTKADKFQDKANRPNFKAPPIKSASAQTEAFKKSLNEKAPAEDKTQAELPLSTPPTPKPEEVREPVVPSPAPVPEAPKPESANGGGSFFDSIA